MFCPKCGVSNSAGAMSCSSCSNPLAQSNAGFQADKAKEQVKVALGDAKATVMSLGLDPVGGLLGAYQGLGKTRALGVGVAFGLVFALCVVFAIHQIPFFRLYANLTGTNGFGGFIKLLVAGFVPFVALTVAGLIGEKAGGGKGDVASDAFIAGVALLPLGIVFLAATLLGIDNISIVGTIAIVGFCLTVLILFAGLTRIGEVSEKAASYAVPLMLVASVWLSKEILFSILG